MHLMTSKFVEQARAVKPNVQKQIESTIGIIGGTKDKETNLDFPQYLYRIDYAVKWACERIPAADFTGKVNIGNWNDLNTEKHFCES